MAATIDPQSGGNRAARWLVTFALDGDTTATIDHGMNGVPDNVYLVPLNAEYHVGQVRRSSVTSTNIVITKTAAVGSAGAQVEVIAYVPHGSL